MMIPRKWSKSPTEEFVNAWKTYPVRTFTKNKQPFASQEYERLTNSATASKL